MSSSGSGGVLVVGEAAANGTLRPVSWELLTAARALADALGGPVTAVIAGVDSATAQSWASAGADRLLLVDDDRLAGGLTGPAAALVQQAAAAVQPAMILVPGTTTGRDYAPVVAARLGAGLAADCVEVTAEHSAISALRPVLGGRAVSRLHFAEGQLAVATIRPGSYVRATAGTTSPTVEPLAVDLDPADLRVKLVGTETKGGEGSRLDSADVVVAGGRGLKEPDKFALVEQLAATLGGAVGATRAVVDMGWRPHHEQIGQTGRTVSPKLYIAVGVSGAVQHNVGMQGSDAIVAINRDPDAPIFKLASFGIVGDLFEVLPALNAEIARVKA
jgi:electron transfer flavoprotein alpha subunit